MPQSAIKENPMTTFVAVTVIFVLGAIAGFLLTAPGRKDLQRVADFWRTEHGKARAEAAAAHKTLDGFLQKLKLAKKGPNDRGATK